ncbi:MAG: hypothetical protein JJT81_10170 [Rubellimicrobium sp.]|nr:hypothetical protein [Rubellimicrobium sp.]
MTQLSDSLLIPALALALVGWLVPRGLSLIFPEGVRPLLLLAFVSTLVMLGIGTGFFLALYVWQGVPFAALFEGSTLAGLAHFVRLGLISALLWGPIMILSVAGLPKHWVKETW